MSHDMVHLPHMRPLVSVVTVTRNSVLTIADAVDSVLSQDYSPLEYVVVDGASTDGTVDVVRNFGARVTKFVSERDDGIYSAMNKGLGMSSGSMILFLNADDRFACNGAIASLVAWRLKNGDASATICYSNFIKYYPTLNRSMVLMANESLHKGFTLCHQAMLVDRSAYDLVGTFDLSFKYAADHDWTARARRRGVRFLKAEIAPTVVFRHGGASNNSYWTSRMEAGRVILREYGRPAYVRYLARQYWVRLLRSLSTRMGSLIGQRGLAGIQALYFRVVRRYRPEQQSARSDHAR